MMGLLEASVLGSIPKVKEGVAGNVSTFLNRSLGLKVEKQNLVAFTRMSCITLDCYQVLRFHNFVIHVLL